MRTALTSLCLLAGLAGASAAERDIQPYELARSLQMLQENVAHGSPTAQEIQKKLLAQMEERFHDAKPAVWEDSKNVTAVLLHAMSGGSPRFLKELIERKAIAEDRLPLAKGILAYAEGRNEAAGRYLRSIDARALTPTLGGYVALAQAVLIADEDPKQALRLLDVARLLMPGMLVEEAALRREILVAVKDGDIEKFERLSRQQLTRFGRSLYASAFRNQFADSIVRLDYGEGTGRFAALEAMLQPLDPADRKSIYLLIAHRAVIGGKTKIAEFAAERAAQEAIGQESEDARAELYAAAAQIVTENFDTGLERLKKIDAKSLSREDAELLDNALKLAERVREWPKQEPAIGPLRPALPHASEDASREDKSFSMILDKATRALRRADQDLKEPLP